MKLQIKNGVGERSPGNWALIIEVKDPITGKRKRKWFSVEANGKKEARAKRAKLATEIKSGAYQEPSKVTLREYLTDWLTYMKSQVTPNTHQRYAGLVTMNIIPLLGNITLTDLKPAHIKAAYASALEGGRRDGKEGGLSPMTVGHMHRVLKQAMQQAVEGELLTRNPVNACKPPKTNRVPVRTYDLAQTVELIDAVRGTSILMPTLLAVLCGLRRGEICALRWRNVNTLTGQLSIIESLEQTNAGLRFKTPKNGKGRTVALSPTMVTELRAYRLERAEALLRLGVRLSDDDLVVSLPDGSVLPPIYVSQHWARAIRKTSLAHLRFHDLRHAHATHMLANGTHPKVASERLGHSRIGITLDLYQHVMPGMQENAVAKLDDDFQKALQKRVLNDVR
jgi:integrase